MSDVELFLAHHATLFGSPPSGSTLCRGLDLDQKVLTGWVVIDADATLITAHSAKEEAEGLAALLDIPERRFRVAAAGRERSFALTPTSFIDTVISSYQAWIRDEAATPRRGTKPVRIT